MAGGMNRGRGADRRTLAERTAPTAGGPGPADASGPGPAAASDPRLAHAPAARPADASGRPCWVAVGERARPGVVHAWRRDATDSGWEGLVVVWVPAEAVRPRTEAPPP